MLAVRYTLLENLSLSATIGGAFATLSYSRRWSPPKRSDALRVVPVAAAAAPSESARVLGSDALGAVALHDVHAEASETHAAAAAAAATRRRTLRKASTCRLCQRSSWQARRACPP